LSGHEKGIGLEKFWIVLVDVFKSLVKEEKSILKSIYWKNHNLLGIWLVSLHSFGTRKKQY